MQNLKEGLKYNLDAAKQAQLLKLVPQAVTETFRLAVWRCSPSGF